MPRTARKTSESGYYHVMARGVSRQLIFEDDADRRAFLALLSELCDERGVRLLAYVLMDNHFHLLVNGPLADVSSCIGQVTGVYAARFNWRHGRCGHLFQNRFRSEPIDDDRYLLAVVRYIHKNPEAAGLASASEWPWSSFREYAGAPELVDPEMILEMLGGVEGFIEFHTHPQGTEKPIDCDDHATGKRLSDGEGLELAQTILGDLSVESISGLPRAERSEAIGRLRDAGLGVRQIQRLTGISLGVISRASKTRR